MLKLLSACRVDISKLPALRPSSKGPIAEVLDHVVTFCAAVRDIAHGNALDKSLVHSSREACRLLKVALRRTAPEFRPFEKPEEFSRPEEPEYLRNEDQMSEKLDVWFKVPEIHQDDDHSMLSNTLSEPFSESIPDQLTVTHGRV